MTFLAPFRPSRSLVLAAGAALGLGVLGGIAADPVMKQTAGSDWRERYRGTTVMPTAVPPDAGAGYGYGYGWRYSLVRDEAARIVDAATVWIDDPVPEPDYASDYTGPALDAEIAVPLDVADAPSDGAAAVAEALTRTADIGSDAPGDDPSATEPVVVVPMGPDAVPVMSLSRGP
ncbi:MAG: hypothetical protein V4579_12550 [Pseudomonadota bacterium]